MKFIDPEISELAARRWPEGEMREVVVQFLSAVPSVSQVIDGEHDDEESGKSYWAWPTPDYSADHLTGRSLESAFGYVVKFLALAKTLDDPRITEFYVGMNGRLALAASATKASAEKEGVDLPAADRKKLATLLGHYCEIVVDPEVWALPDNEDGDDMYSRYVALSPWEVATHGKDWVDCAATKHPDIETFGIFEATHRVQSMVCSLNVQREGWSQSMCDLARKAEREFDEMLANEEWGRIWRDGCGDEDY